MKKYRILWSPAAEQQLATLWLDATDRDAIQQAADQLDELLATDPRELGESRQGNDRLTIQLPLAIEFRVFDADMKVKVLAVWAPRRRGP